MESKEKEQIQEEDIEDLFYIPHNNWSLSTSIPNMSFLSYMVVEICSMKKRDGIMDKRMDGTKGRCKPVHLHVCKAIIKLFFSEKVLTYL